MLSLNLMEKDLISLVQQNILDYCCNTTLPTLILLHLQNCLFVSQIEQNQTLAKSIVAIKHCGDNHNYQTRASTKRILDISLYKTIVIIITRL